MYICLHVAIVYHLMISAYSLSLPLLSLHLRNMTEASTLAGENVLGSLSSEITLSRIVLIMRKHHTDKQKMRTVQYQMLSLFERKSLFETVLSFIPAQTEAVPELFLLAAQLQATPNLHRFSNSDSALYLHSWRKCILLTC